ncbi:zinc finger ZZ-type and EF-hand domain-containing protein 1-like isoform X1 [Haliotis cracherodii]|uniref:zinc finger ZZ-type and EF-hand domain-containing protein 1-like isoform X1 n=1 Tax=Haliotis cracherodii TaxID=6455 RepID=UPI0039EAC73B
MGNTASSDSEDEVRVDNKEVDDGYSDSEAETGDKDGPSLTDLHALFNEPGLLRSVASKIKDPIPDNVIHQYHGHIIRWLRERQDRMEENVTLSQFCDMLMAKGVTRNEVVKAFQQFDTDGSGVAEVSTMMDALSTFSSGNVMGELGKNIRMLQACSLTAGFVDVYAGDKNPMSRHGEKILKYLLRNRAETSSLPFPHLNGFNNTSNMRMSVLKSTFTSLKDAAKMENEEQELAEGEELKPITKCFSAMEVSTNSSDAYRLTNGDPYSFWQSDGAARTHWIRLRMRNNVVIKQLSVSVASSDQSYMPELVMVSAGRSPRALRELKEVRIASHFTGDVVLLKNAKVFYPIIQINIKRCHSDGCDTRIHGIKTVGYRVVREPGVTVMDATAMWYLQILASTVSATVPQSPQLRLLVLQHTKKALEHMPPLSLSLASTDRPQFLSKHVMQEMETFITELASKGDEIIPEGLHLLLGLNLARGNVAGLLKTLKHFYRNPELTLPCSGLLLKMIDARNSCWERLESPLQFSVCGCDGGQSDETSSAENVTLKPSGNAPQPYLSEEGKTKVNMFFKAQENIQLTKLRIKITPGGRGPRRGLVFVFRESKEFKLEEQIERFNLYDTWHELEYNFSVQVRNVGIGGKPDNPVSFFMFDDDCDEMDVPVSWYPTGQYVLIKFLEPRQESAGKIGVISIKFYGFVRKSPFTEEEVEIVHPPNPEKRPETQSPEISKWVLTFLVDLAQDQVRKRGRSAKPECLDFYDVQLQNLWNLYKNFISSKDERWRECSLLLLQLLHSLTPTLSPLKDEDKATAEEMFQHLCKMIDTPNTDPKSKPYRLAQELIVDGASLFFPDKETKRQRLFNMMNNVDNLATAPSVSLVFQSLCQFFSSVDPRGLLDLPTASSEKFDASHVIDVMQTLIVVAGQEFEASLDSAEQNEKLTYLIRLTGSLQTSLLTWCWQQMMDGDDAMKLTAVQTALKYSIHVSNKGVEALKLFKRQPKEKIEQLVKALQPAFLSSVIRQLVLILTYLCDHFDCQSRVSLLHNFQLLSQELVSMASTFPDLFPKITSENWGDMKADDIVLRTWSMESPHNYDNNSYITQVFSCPGATKLIVDFDPRCETERRYDYLEFTDAKGLKMKFDQKVGTPKWQKQVVFSGPHLHFLFRSDSSNTEWGYKFLVTAKGTPDIPLSWPYDLQLGLAKLFGRLCGATLSSNPILPKDSIAAVEESAEQDVLQSELWTSLFRGGYMVGKLQRSLSGRVATDEATTVLSFLWNMINGQAELAKAFLQKCRDLKVRVSTVGGEEVDSAVTAIFAALLWHTQQLREEVDRYCQSKGSIHDGIGQAYAAAESLRMMLASQRQSASAKKSNLPEDENPVHICKEKALYLLKFAGLTKVQLRQDMRSKANKHLLRKLGNKKSDKNLLKPDLSDKYPSFRLVMEFVQDPAWTTDRVHQMLQERSQYATAVSDVHMFSAEFVRIMSGNDPFQIPIVLFLQELFSYQDKFAKHYADGLDGCGLEQEAKVRRSYYTLVRRLVEGFQRFHHHEVDEKVVPAYDFVQACLLHLLDTQWQPYDLSFVADIKLPELFISIAKETVKMRDRLIGKQEEEEELKEYDQYMHWFEESSRGFSNWYRRKEDASKEEKKAIQMFVARFCDLLDVEISCDGCGATLPGRRYRCLQCVDMDLCTTCYSGGVKPHGEHKDEHDIVHLVYKCNKCQAFIVGTRVHCNACDDFDLCLGCHKKAKFPSGHLETHDITMIPLVKLKTSQATDSLIQAYIHQHVWLLFSALTMGLGDVIYNSSSQAVDPDYVKLAAQQQNQCITLITSCLEKVPDDADDGSKRLLQEEPRPLESRQEEAFAIHSQERIMGLLGAMIPSENKESLTGETYNFTTGSFLDMLFKIAKGESGHELNTQHLAMGLLGRLLAKSSTKVADESVRKVLTAGVKESSTEGETTVNHLFRFGAYCLERSGLEWACSMARILGTLSNSDQWKSVVHHHISSCVQSLRQKPELSSIFAMFVMAGFPEVLTMGTLVHYTHTTLEAKNGVVIKHFPDKYRTLVVDLKTRKRHIVKDQYVMCVSETAEAWDTEHMSEFTGIIMDTVTKLRAGEENSVENMWVLSLALKVLNNSLKAGEKCLTHNFFKPEFIQSLVFVASKGTGFSQQWLLKDLEVLSLMLYTHDGSANPVKKTKLPGCKDDPSRKKDPVKDDNSSKCSDDENRNEDDDLDEELNLSSSSSSSSSSSDSDTSWEGNDKEVFGVMDEKTKSLFEALHHELKVPLSVLRVMFDMNDGNLEAVMKAIVENFEGSEEVKAFMEKWEGNADVKASVKALHLSVGAERVIDTGIHFHPALKGTPRTIDKAVEESGQSSENLIQQSDSLQGDISEKSRSKSAELLKKELEKHGRVGSREYLAKVNMAMGILYARHLLTGLLAYWPEYGHVINASLLGCKEVQQIPCVLDLLYKTDNRNCFKKVVQKVIQHCDKSSLVPIAYTACQFMEEVTLSAVARESDHNYKLENKEEMIPLPGASFLTITFDSKCATKEDYSELTFSTNESLTKDVHSFSGTSKSKWSSFQVPGDTVYYKFTCSSDDGPPELWGYKFTITAGTRDSFETGHTILESVLSSDVALCLPLCDLWSSLVYVACKQTGTQRLKAIQLLLKITQTQFRCRLGTDQKPSVDPGLLKPLWFLYTSLTKDDADPGNVLPPVVRALSELFLQVENLVMEWDMHVDYLVAVQDIEDIRKVVGQGLINIAAIGHMIGYKNSATELALAVKKRSTAV